MGRIENLDDLKQLMNIWFNVNIEDITNTGDHAIMFFVAGKIKIVHELLKKYTEENDWEISPGNFFYENKLDNFGIYLRSVSNNTMIMASVITLHKIYLDKYR